MLAFLLLLYNFFYLSIFLYFHSLYQHSVWQVIPDAVSEYFVLESVGFVLHRNGLQKTPGGQNL